MLSKPRRLPWNDERRVRVLKEAFAPGTCVSLVARRHHVSRGALYKWRKRLMYRPELNLIRLTGVPAIEAAMPEAAAIVIELLHGNRISIPASTPPKLAAAVVKAIRLPRHR